MNPDDLYQRQMQINRLHKRIREYRLTPEEIKELDKNKIDQEALIETKFASSKANEIYRFPRTVHE